MSDETVKRALLVGIDKYQHFQSLNGCVNDVVALAPLLARHADENENFACIEYRSDLHTINRDAVLAGLDRLLAPGADVALFYFAGHGMQATNDVVLVTQPTRTADDGVALSTVLAKVQQSTVGSFIIILDCCFSGGAGGVPQLGGNVAALRDGLTILT